MITPELPRALCREVGGDLWYPEENPGTVEVRMAKQICYACPERLPCLNFALENREQHGIWGGMTPKERRREAARRRWNRAA